MEQRRPIVTRARDEDEPPGPYLRRLRDAPQETIQRLYEEAAARTATSLGEARAAAYLDGRLRRASLRVTADAFMARATPGWEGITIGGLALIAVAVYYWLPLLALGIAATALGIALGALTQTGVPLLSHRRPSQNVVGTRAAIDARHRRMVLMAPLDTPLPSWHPAEWLGRGTFGVARVAAAALLACAALVGSFNPQILWLIIQIVPLVLLLAGAICDLLALRSNGLSAPARTGAGLAVLLSVCEGLDDLHHTELWAIGLGATSSGAGLADLLRRYPFDRGTTLFIGLEALHKSGPGYLSGTTWPTPRSTNTELLSLADATARTSGADLSFLQNTGVQTIVGALAQDGWQALTVVCVGPSGESAADQHASLDRTTQFVSALVNASDTI